MTLCKYFFLILRNFIRNFHYLGKFDLLTSIHQKEPSDYKDLRQSILQCKKQIICNYYSIHPTEAITYKEELNYLNSVDFIDPFPYPTIKHYKNVQSGFDEEKLMSFVLHNEKKMYLPKGWGTKDAVNYYLRFIERENILGGEYTTKSPHQYQSNLVHIDEGDIVIDAGAAEGLFALDIIEKAKFIYLLEVEPEWIDALKASFEPYKEKVQIVPKFLSSIDSENNITLSSLLEGKKHESIFIKMDIEGVEEDVLSSNEKFLDSENTIKISCCTYHCKEHATTIPALLNKHNFKTEMSDGFMVFYWDPNLNAPYFRKGLVRAIRG